MKVACVRCGRSWEAPEGSNVAGAPCPGCGAVQGDFVAYAPTVRFEAVDDPAYGRAVARAREGDVDGALAALEEAFAKGFEDVERAEHDPALAAVRKDPRFGALLARIRGR